MIFLIAHFSVPTSSMYPAIHAGSRVFVNKMAYGARLFDVRNKIEAGDITRIWGYSSPQRNDIMVCNDPYTRHKDTITFDVMRYIVKRCIALPGDIIEIKDGYYRVRGLTDTLGNIKMQRRLSICSRDSLRIRRNELKMEAFPHSDSLGWTIRNFGPLYIPRKGDTIRIDNINKLLYGNIIRWECQSDTDKEQHIMKDSYYFLAGDNCMESYDSRYWGLIPGEFIVGRVDYIYE